MAKNNNPHHDQFISACSKVVLRYRGDMKQKEFAAIVGLQQCEISRLEHGKGWSFIRVVKVCNAIGISLDMFVQEVEKELASFKKR